MITEAIIDMAVSLGIFILSHIPNLSLPEQIIGGMAAIVELLGGVTFIMPVSTFILAITWWFLLTNTKFIMSMINWILRRFPTQS